MSGRLVWEEGGGEETGRRGGGGVRNSGSNEWCVRAPHGAERCSEDRADLCQLGRPCINRTEAATTKESSRPRAGTRE
jgi:hypothetical protein